MLLEAFAVRLLMAATALFLLYVGQFFLLRLFDKHAGVNFKKSFDCIETDPKALAHYYGLRWLGMALATGLVVCAAMIL